VLSQATSPERKRETKERSRIKSTTIDWKRGRRKGGERRTHIRNGPTRGTGNKKESATGDMNYRRGSGRERRRGRQSEQRRGGGYIHTVYSFFSRIPSVKK
jgi:hypothetical protein